MDNNHEEVKFVFPKPPTGGFQQVKGKQVEDISMTIEEIINYFKKYRVESIELYIEGGFKTGGVINFILSAEAKGSCKVILKPSEQ
jgi:hypothetical protein